MEADFSGWATRSDILCTDGRTIEEGAFKHQDGHHVPLVWRHQHNGLDNQLGFAVLEHRAGGMYTYGYFNNTPAGRKAKELVDHGEVSMLSIFADGLKETDKLVHSGNIGEVSLVRVGANKGAVIDNVYLQHGDAFELVEDEAIITTGLALEHENKEATVADTATPTEAQVVWDSMSEEQQQLATVLVASGVAAATAAPAGDTTNADGTVTHADGTTTLTDGTLRHADGSITNADGTPLVDASLQHQEGQNNMTTRNAFEGGNGPTDESVLGENGRPQVTLRHADIRAIIAEMKKPGVTMKTAIMAHSAVSDVLAHADGDYGVEDIDFLFPDAKTLQDAPSFVKRRTEWVDGVLTGVNSIPFTRVKTIFADITHEEARAKGYIKATMKKEEYFGLTKRVTEPKTIYKKQKLDRDDILDITSFDIVVWIKAEMRVMLDEEIARAILISDGREVDDPDKIDETKVRPIAYDDDFFAVKVDVPANVTAQDAVEYILRHMDEYHGQGRPTLYTSYGFMIDMLLAKDKQNRRLYSTKQELADAMLLKNIVDVEVMNTVPDILGIIVNLADYTVGADKGGKVTMFEDFDIDWNQEKYLLESRISGALTGWKSAIILRRTAGTQISVTEPGFSPTFVPATGVVTIPTRTGVTYKNADTGTTLTAGAQSAIAAGATIEVEAVANTGYSFPHGTDTDWEFTRPLA